MELKCSKRLLEQIVDRFGDNVFVTNIGETTFEIGVECAVSHGLCSWIAGFGDEIQVISPDSLKDMMVERAQKILDIYK